MQNVEIEDVFNKNVNFVLYDQNGKKFDQTMIKRSYIVFWYDAKMKNYLTFLDYLQKKKLI